MSTQLVHLLTKLTVQHWTNIGNLNLIVNVLDFVQFGCPILTIRTNFKLSPHTCPIPLFNRPSGLRPLSRN